MQNKVKTIEDTVNLVLKSCDTSPYSGKLSEKDSYIASIEVAKLCLDFSEKGHSDEAMNFNSTYWSKVIEQLEDKLHAIK